MKARKRITTVLTIVLLVNGTAFAQDFEFELEHLVPPVPGALTHYAGNHPTAGVDRVRVFWINSDGEAQAISEAQVQGNRDYSGCFFIPEDAAEGNHEILALGIGDPSELVAEASATVVARQEKTIVGSFTFDDGSAFASGDVILFTSGGDIAAQTTTAADGSYSFSAVPPGSYVVQAVSNETRFDPIPVGVGTPGTGSVIDLGSFDATEPRLFVNPKVHYAGAIVVPKTGSMWSDRDPMSLGIGWNVDPDDGAFAKLGTMNSSDPGAELMVRFYAFASFPDTAPLNKRIVRLLLKSASGQTVYFAGARTPSPLYPGVFDFSAYSSTVFVGDLNVSALPAGKYELVVEADVEDAVITEDGWRKVFKVHIEDLGKRWINDWVEPVSVGPNGYPVSAKPGVGGVEYVFTGNLPKPGQAEYDFSFGFDLFDLNFQNTFSLDATGLTEHWDPDRGFFLSSKPPKFSADVTIMNQEFVDKSRKVSYQPMRSPEGITGYRMPPTTFADTTFATIPLYQIGPGIGCVDLWFAQVCAGWKVYVDFTLAGDLVLSSNIYDDLRLDATFDPGVKGILGGHVRIKAVICSASADVTGTVRVSLPIEYATGANSGFSLREPCVTLAGSIGADISCLGIGFGAGGSIGPYELLGCDSSGALQNMKPKTAKSVSPFRVEAAPDVDAAGGGKAMSVWIQDEATSPSGYLPFVYFSKLSGGTWTTPARLTPTAAIVSDPKVVCLDNGDAIAVWVQNKKSLVQAIADGSASAKDQEIMAARWDGTSWGTPVALTNDAVGDGLPDLASNGFEATAVWGRAIDDASNQPQAIVVSATFADGSWSAQQLVSADPTKFATEPRVDYGPGGDLYAAWTSDTDRDFTTFADRKIAYASHSGTWAAGSFVVGTPPGAFAPDIAVGHENEIIVAFSVPPLLTEDGISELTSGFGNRSTLWAGNRAADNIWHVAQVTPTVYAEFADLEWETSSGAPRIFYRGFSNDEAVHQFGDAAVLVGRRSGALENEFTWHGDFLTHDNQSNWMLAASVDPDSGENFILSVKQDPFGRSFDQSTIAAGAEIGRQLPADFFQQVSVDGPSIAASCIPTILDAALDTSNIVFSDPNPDPGDQITISVRVTNEGLLYAGGYEFRLEGFQEMLPGIEVPILTTTFDDLGGLGSERWITFGYNVPTEPRPLRFALTPLQPWVDTTNTDNNVLHFQSPNPIAPTSGLSAQFDSEAGSVTLRWIASDSPNVENSLIERRENGSGEFNAVGLVLPLTEEFEDILIQAGMTYEYRVVPQAGDLKADHNEIVAILIPSDAPAWRLAPPTLALADDSLFLEWRKQGRWRDPVLEFNTDLGGWRQVDLAPLELTGSYRWILPREAADHGFLRVKASLPNCVQ